jgi:hypothetical protein
VSPADIQNGVLVFSAVGLKSGAVLKWSADLAVWHECPAGAFTVTENGDIRVNIHDVVNLPAERCFFKIVNPR